jgi:hypothetical protein
MWLYWLMFLVPEAMASQETARAHALHGCVALEVRISVESAVQLTAA